MPQFGPKSKRKLSTIHPDLQRVCNEVIKWYDYTVLVGHRGREAQDEAFDKGRSKLKWPRSKHNQTPSLAVDVAPYPVDWNDHGRFHLLAGYMLHAAAQLGIRLRWGGDWDGNPRTKNNFNDLPHFEIKES